MKEKQLEKWLERTSAKKRIIMSAVTIGIVAVLAVGGCSTQSKTSKMSTAKTTANKEVSGEIVEPLDAKAIEEMKRVNEIVKFRDFNVLVGSLNVDLKQIAVVESDADIEEVIKSVEIDASKVDVNKTGKYMVDYKVTVQETPEAEEEVLTTKATAIVVSNEEAKKLIANGEEVVVSNNEVISTEEQLKEAVKVIEDSKKTAEKTEEKKEESKKEKPKKEEPKKENNKTQSNNGSTSNGGSTSNSGSTSDSGSKNEGHKHTHNWVEQFRTVDDYQTVTDYENQPIYEEQPIYETRPVYTKEYHIICGCGVDCGTDRTAHTLGYDGSNGGYGCNMGYSVQAVSVQTGTESVQVGTQQVQVGTQQVAVGSHQEKVGSHQESAGYVCSGCGATK